MNSRFLTPILLAAAIAFACGPRPHSGAATATATAATPPTAQPHLKPRADVHKGRTIASSLDVRVKEGVGFVFHVTNSSAKTIELQFPSGQTHDFVVIDPKGREIWRWSGDRMFTQALRTKVLDPGETASFDGRWDPTGHHGEFVALATLKSSTHPVETRLEFSLP